MILNFKHHFQPDSSFYFPKKIMLKCNRLCKVEYFKHKLAFIKSNESFFVYPVLSLPYENQCFHKKDKVISRLKFLKNSKNAKTVPTT